MCIEKNSTIIGLTGSFGSGCSSLAEALKQLGYECFSLSKVVKDQWEKENPGKKISSASRDELQNIGNELREKKGYDFLARKISTYANQTYNGEKKEGFVFDSIRNTAEIKWFRDNYPNFYLIAVDCPRSIRWERVKKIYYKEGYNESDFEKNDKRDKNEERSLHGQQVQLCVYEADVIIDNSDNYFNEVAIKKLKDKVKKLFLDRISEDGKLKVPNDAEFCMTIAYCASLMSKCIKRQVGAGIADRNNVIVSVGYNQNPNHKSCIDTYGKCHRDLYKDNLLKDSEEIKCPNPHCKKTIKNPFRCQDCNARLDKLLIPDKALSRCLALHAEEIALMNIGIKDLEGYTLYTTTYPCLICARKIAYSGIKKIVYVEAYTDPDSEEYIKESGIEAIKFEGITARAYFRLFGSSRSKTENELNGSLKIIDVPKVPIYAKTKTYANSHRR